MAVSGLAMYQNLSMSYTIGKPVWDFDSDRFMNQLFAFHGKENEVLQQEDGNVVNTDKEIDSELRFGVVQRNSPIGKYGELKPYTRCITAKVNTKEIVTGADDGEKIFSYREEEKSFSIFINCDGKNKTYTIRGLDENGQETEEEFDPYNLDPEMLDFPEFTALCMYIRQTDETADLMSKISYIEPLYFDNIYEKGDRLSMLKNYSEECRGIDQYLSNQASSLFDAINDFFDRTIWNSRITDEELFLLVADLDDIETQEKISAIKNGYAYSDTTTDAIFETIVSKHNQYTDPDTGEIVPVNIKYITAFTEQGISCKEISDVGGKISNAPEYRNQFFEMASQNVSSDIDATAASDISDKAVIEEQPLPGFGTALAGNMGYGMKASLVISDSTDDVIVRVKVAKGGGNSEEVDVNLSEFDSRNATAVEMFAYCQYKDTMGEGSDHKWGSWNAIKSVISPVDGMDFGSLDNIINEKRNWTGALAKSKTYMENPKTGETLSAADLLKMFEEQNKLTAEELKEGDDWRNMSDEDWDKLLSGVDNYIDAYKEDIRERVKKQLEAAQKAALEADSEMRSAAAQEAALSVAATGFDGGDDAEGAEAAEATGEDPGIDHEKNWTRKLKTDDQTVLRTAKAARAMENMALSRMEQIVSAGLSAYDSYDGVTDRYRRDRRFMNYA